MSKRFQEINDKEKEVQLSLFSLSENKKKIKWPDYRRGDKYLQSIINNPDKYLGLDLEFDIYTKRPTILGLSNSDFCASDKWDELKAEELVDLCKKGHKLVGFSVNGAEKAVFETQLGLKLPIEYFEDAMILFYLFHQHLTKSQGGKADYEKGALGFINLWTCASLLTDLPMWKLCREIGCNGSDPCPRHDVWGYNAIDAYAGLKSFTRLKEQCTNRQYSLYRDVMTLSEIAQKMQDNGIRVDRELVKKLDNVTEEEKEKLFPFIENSGKKLYDKFNPNSGTEAIKYFKKNGIKLESYTKTEIVNHLKKLAKKAGMDYDDYVTNNENPLIVKDLINAALFKGAGKGFKGWFGDRYFGSDGFIHPRFITSGTCTGRWSSSKPNFTNIPSYNEEEGSNTFSQARMGVIPKRKEDVLVKYDKSNLEYRMAMFLAGFDVHEILPDAFQWMVDTSNGAYLEASQLVPGRNERFIAKSVAYGAIYGEGFTLYDDQDLTQKKRRKELDEDALRVNWDWKYCGKYVCFTGVNLAERLFGKATNENRQKALVISEDIFFKQFSILREWHKKVMREVELHNLVKSPYGRFLKLYDTPKDNVKVGLSFYGQGCGADHVQSGMLRFYQEHGDEGVPLIQVHDELVFEKPRDWSNDNIKEFLKISEEEDYRLPGFYCPVKMYRGENWAQMEKI